MARGKKSPPPTTAGSTSLAKIEAHPTISLASGGAMPGTASRRRISVIDVGPNTDEELAVTMLIATAFIIGVLLHKTYTELNTIPKAKAGDRL
jgi:hypothetical protein